MTRTPGDRALRLQIRAEAERFSRELSRFTREAWPVIEPGTDFVPGWHIDLFSEYLEAVTAGEINRLIVNVPPRYMKSISVSVMWPVWVWTRSPGTRFMFSSYAQGLATKHSVDRRTIIQSDWFQERWGSAFHLVDPNVRAVHGRGRGPHFALSGDQNVKTEFVNDRRGHMIATSFKGTATGKGGDVIVIDDPLDPEQAHSAVERERVNRTFDQKFSTRLDDKERGAIVVVMQRLHDDDLTGHLLEKGGWTHVSLPGLAEREETVRFPRSERAVIRLPGQVLWPEREPAEVVDRMKVDLGAFAFAAQYQQRPTPIEGGILKRGWWRFYDPENVDGTWELPHPQAIVTSWDTALKAKTSNDYTVGTVWALHGANRYLLRIARGRWSLPEAKREVRQLAEWAERKFPHVGHSIIVENAANGPDIVAELRDEVAGLMLSSPEGDKVARAHAASPQLEAGNVLVPGVRLASGESYDPARTPADVQALIEECAAFPNGTHDDQVDSVTQALIRFRTGAIAPLARRDDTTAAEGRRAVTAGLESQVF